MENIKAIVLIILVWSIVIPKVSAQCNQGTDCDNDGICDFQDICPNVDDNLIGLPCDDGNDCTTNDLWTTNCECEGTALADSDNDGVCDLLDICPGFNDDIDIDKDDIPYCQDSCIDYDEDGICDDVDPAVTVGKLKLYFSHERGFYDNNFQLQIFTNDPTAIIKYSTATNIPSSTSGSTYSSPIQITGQTVVKVIAYSNLDTTELVTHSYIFIQDVIQSSINSEIKNDPVWGNQLEASLKDLPTISISGDGDFLSNDASIASLQTAISFEYIELNETDDFQINAGINAFGSHSLNNLPKKSYRIKFEDAFGDDHIDYPMFAGFAEGIEAAEKFDKLNLRASQDSWLYNPSGDPNYFSAKFVDDLMKADGNINPHSKHVHVFMNGEYWGMYTLREHFDDNSVSEYEGFDNKDYNYISGTDNPINEFRNDGELLDGDGLFWNDLVSSSTNYDVWKTMTEESSFFDMMIFYMVFFIEAEWKAVGTTLSDDGFIFNLNDADFMFTRTTSNNGNRVNLNNSSGPDDMFENLYNSNDINFFRDFADRVQCHYQDGGVLTEESLNDRVDDLASQIELGMIAESGRWGESGENPSKWANEINRIKQEFTNDQPADVLGYLKNFDLFPNMDMVEFDIEEGFVESGDLLTLNNPNSAGDIYYTLNGEDVVTDNGSLNANAVLYTQPIVITEIVTQIIARVYDPSQSKYIDRWSAFCTPKTFFLAQNYTNLVINEIHYNPNDSIFFNPAINALDTVNGRNFEFIELKNIGDEPIHLFGSRFSKGIQYEIDELIVVEPNGFVVFAEDAYWFEAKYGFAPDGRYSGQLDNSGEKINFKDPKGYFIDTLRYDDGGNWPGTADKGYYSVALLDATLDNSDPVNWAIQSVFTTPGAENYFTNFGEHSYSGIVINEIHYNPFDSLDTDGSKIDGKNYEFIELKNISAAVIDLSLSFFSRGVEYVFPENTLILPGQIIVLAEDKSSFEDRYGFAPFDKYDGKLSNSGEALWLNQSNGILIDAVNYSSSFPWDSQANGGLQDYSLALIDGDVDNDTRLNWRVQCDNLFTPGAENDFSCFGGLSYPGLTINEIHYNPSGGTAYEFIEIANHSNILLDLEGVNLSLGAFYLFDSHLLPGAITAPQNILVLAKDSTAFHDRYGFAPHGVFFGTLSNLGESLKLQDIFGELIDQVTYDDVSPWDTNANLGSHSLALIDGALDNNVGQNWCVQDVGFTPRAVNAFGDSDGDLVIDCLDVCPGVDDALIATACDDGDPCTVGDVYDSFCNCVSGNFEDSDADGVCDTFDVCPGFDDSIDVNNNNIPDGCEVCEDFIFDLSSNIIALDTSANIKIETNGFILNGSVIDYHAGESVELKSGFEVEMGAVFHAYISPCN